MAVDEAWRFGNIDESFEGVRARGQRKDMVEYGIDATSFQLLKLDAVL